MKNFSEFLNESVSDKPSFIRRTFYDLPTEEQIIEFGMYPNLTPDEILNGICYSIIGRGIKTMVNIRLVKNSIEMLMEKFPNDKRYLEAYELSKELKPKF